MLPIPLAHGRAVPLAITALAATGLLTACASASSSSGAAQPAAGSSSSSPAASHAASTPASTATAKAPAKAPAGAGTLAACAPSSLRASLDVSAAGGAAGSIYYPVNFTNTSGTACGMYGYPGVSFVTAESSAARQIGAAAQRNPQFSKLAVRLAAGGEAHAWLQVAEAGNYPSATCKPVTAHWLRVFAPGTTVALYVNHAFDACDSTSTPLLTVMPVRAGHGVRGVTP